MAYLTPTRPSLRQEILDPLGMTSAALCGAAPYDHSTRRCKAGWPYAWGGPGNAAGGLVATPTDVAKLGTWLLEGTKPFMDKHYELFRTPLTPLDESGKGQCGGQYGAGGYCLSWGRYLLHGGSCKSLSQHCHTQTSLFANLLVLSSTTRGEPHHNTRSRTTLARRNPRTTTEYLQYA